MTESKCMLKCFIHMELFIIWPSKSLLMFVTTTNISTDGRSAPPGIKCFTTTVVLSSSFGSGYSDDIDDMIDFIIMFPHLSFWFLLDFFTPGNGTSAENAYPSPYLTLWNNPHLYLHPCSKRGRDKVVNQQGMSSPISISISP